MFNKVLYRVVGILLVLVLYTTHLTGGLLAKFATRDKSNENAFVSAFKIGLSVEQVNSVNLNNETKVAHTITIENKSDVAIRCDLIIVFDEEFPNGTVVKLQNKEGVTTNNKSFRFNDVADISANNTYDCLLEYDIDVDDFTVDADGLTYTNLRKFTVSVVATQID